MAQAEVTGLIGRPGSLQNKFSATILAGVLVVLVSVSLGFASLFLIKSYFTQAASIEKSITVPALNLQGSINGAAGVALFDRVPGAIAKCGIQEKTVDARLGMILSRVNDPFEIAHLNESLAAWKSSDQVVNRWLSMPAGQRTAAAESASTQFVRDVVTARAQDGLAAARSHQIGTSLLAKADLVIRITLLMLAALGFIGVLATVMVGRKLARSILDPLVLINGGLGRLGGDLSYRLEANRQDELGAVATEINSMAARLEQLQNQESYQARHDQLTGLGNRLLLAEELASALEFASSQHTRVGVLLLDLDGFKEVNDTLGHHYGDELLRQIGPRIERTIRRDDTIVRLGGDEFAVVIPVSFGLKADAEDFLKAVAVRMLDGLAEPFNVGGVTLRVEASAGVAIYPFDGSTSEELLQHADVAMYVAKRRRSGYTLYDSSLDVNEPRKLRLLSQLPAAMSEGQLEMYFQPIVEIATGKLEGAEALIRWKHPTEGLLGAPEFIHLAEDTGMIHQLTSEVLRLSLEQCRRWTDSGLPVRVSVNISVRSLLDSSFPNRIALALREAGLTSDVLRLEVTESAIMADPARAAEVLQRIELLGVAISIDDFGTGYTSMSYIRDLPVHELKIDLSFVQRMAVSNRDAAIVQTSIDLARRLGMSTVAEGVESDSVRKALQAMGCRKGQGFLYSEPLPADQFYQWIHEWNGAGPAYDKLP